MLISQGTSTHLTYCLNIHPGESWEENLAAIKDKALVVRRGVAPGRAFGLGLRLSDRAASELLAGQRLAEFKRFLADENLYVFTINGFPFGSFHDTVVKEAVYSPDWRDGRRAEYTVKLATVLAGLLPEDVPGSISTVPCSYKAWIRDAADVRRMAEMLADTSAKIDGICRRAQRDICLTMEPEPDCFLETTGEVVRFFTGPLQEAAARAFKANGGPYGGDWERALRQRLGVCLDTAHAAVEFEDPSESLKQLADAGIRVGKIQLSAAVIARPEAKALARLNDFVDRVYLHQVKARGAGGRITSWPDLPAALDAAARVTPPAGDEWRVHFHVPLFFEGDDVLSSTRSLLTPEFFRAACACPNLEIETYTFNVLPEYLRRQDVAQSIIREFDWVLGAIGRRLV